jgi:hypothetical protein
MKNYDTGTLIRSIYILAQNVLKLRITIEQTKFGRVIRARKFKARNLGNRKDSSRNQLSILRLYLWLSNCSLSGHIQIDITEVLNIAPHLVALNCFQFLMRIAEE